MIHRTILTALYATALIFAVAVAVKAGSYYALPLNERAHSELHRDFKPGGVWGHGLGVLGSTMMLLLFVYSIRKRRLLGLRFGKIKNWLNIHIFFGVMGPVFVTLHTTFKFGGIVSVSYYSMMAVMLSGFIGRYLYVQIPRKLSGDEMTMREMEEKNKLMTRLLVENYGIKSGFLEKIDRLSGVPKSERLSGPAAILTILKNDWQRPTAIRKLRRQILASNGKTPLARVDRLIAIIEEKALLTRKMILLSAIQPLFHYWHVIHKPFAYVMVIIMFLHIGVTVLFGFRWVF